MKRFEVSMWLGSLLLLVVALYMIIWKSIDAAVAVLALVGALIVASSFPSPGGSGKVPEKWVIAAGYSWFVTIVFAGLLIFTGYYSGRVFNPAEILGLIIFVMVATILLAVEYLKRR